MFDRLRLLALLPLLALDCAGNLVILRNSWRYTISSEAWNGRDSCTWCWRAIDTVFGRDHCRLQAQREALHGGVWAAWAAEWKTLR